MSPPPRTDVPESVTRDLARRARKVGCRPTAAALKNTHLTDQPAPVGRQQCCPQSPSQPRPHRICVSLHSRSRCQRRCRALGSRAHAIRPKLAAPSRKIPQRSRFDSEAYHDPESLFRSEVCSRPPFIFDCRLYAVGQVRRSTYGSPAPDDSGHGSRLPPAPCPDCAQQSLPSTTCITTPTSGTLRGAAKNYFFSDEMRERVAGLYGFAPAIDFVERSRRSSTTPALSPNRDRGRPVGPPVIRAKPRRLGSAQPLTVWRRLVTRSQCAEGPSGRRKMT